MQLNWFYFCKKKKRWCFSPFLKAVKAWKDLFQRYDATQLKDFHFAIKVFVLKQNNIDKEKNQKIEEYASVHNEEEWQRDGMLKIQGGTEAEIQLPLKRSSRFQCLFPNPSWLVWGRASRHQKLASTFPGIDSCLMVTKWDFLEMEVSLWLNGKSQNVAEG